MPASFLHGVETVEITKGARTVQTVKTAVVGIVGTAPIDDVEQANRTINTPTLILNETEAVKYFGKHKNGYTIIRMIWFLLLNPRFFHPSQSAVSG